MKTAASRTSSRLAALTLWLCVAVPHLSAQVVQVAAPTGDRAKDLASVQAALAAVRSGGTVQFAAGTYLIGGALSVTTSGVTLAGHRDGTVLQGCTTVEMAAMQETAFFARCRGPVLRGGRQTVRGLTFEQFVQSLEIGQASAPNAPPAANTDGGHLIEDNTFRNSVSLQMVIDADAPVVIRRNRFRNTYHAVAMLGRNMHFLDNDVSAPEPERVPFGWPSLAIGIRPDAGIPCTGNRIEGNTVEGHTDGVVMGVLPPDGPGAVCEGNTVRNNVIRMRPVRHSKEAGPMAGTPAFGVPIRLINLQTAVGTGAMTFPMPAPPEGWPPAFSQAAVRGNTIEGNQIDGARGVAIELVFASGNHVANNRIGVVTPFTAAEHKEIARAPFGIGPGFWLTLGGWPAANGTGIWQSKGSEGNTLSGNVVAGGR
jgi:parallel beta-helix repeat protein